MTLRTLAAKLAFGFVGLVALVLIVNGAIDAFLSYSQAKRAALDVQGEKARAAAERVGLFVDEIQTQLGWTAGVEWGYAKLEQQRYDFIRLLRQAPAITALSYLDPRGHEQLAVSRLEPDAVGSGKDFSADPRFVRAVADKVWFGPVEFRRGSEPYMTMALAHVGKTPGVTSADVNLKLVWDVVSAIHVGDKGFAYVVDDHGRLIAHPDLSLVLRNTDFSQLPQVAAALKNAGAAGAATSHEGAAVLTAYAVEPRTHWVVFVEQPLSEALVTAYRSLVRSLALLGFGLTLAAVSGVALARRMAAPIRALQAGAERLGAGDLTQRLDIRTGDEIEALAGGFNQMAERLQESYENLEGKVEARTRDLTKALERQTATAEILKVIASSPSDAQPVFEAIVTSAKRLLGGRLGLLTRFVGDVAHLASFTPVNPEYDAAIVAAFPRLSDDPVAVHLRAGRTALMKDTESEEHWGWREGGRQTGFRSAANVPLVSQGVTIGGLTVNSAEPDAFDADDVELLRTFADQAVIAIENVRLFNETKEALERQTATADVLKVISRSAFDLQAVFNTLISSAVELMGAHNGTICVREGDNYRYRASSGVEGEWTKILAANPPRPGRGSATGRVLLTGQIHAIPDVLEDPDYVLPISGVNRTRSVLGVPLLRGEVVQGALLLARLEPGPFEPRQIELMRTFADQAVIAIENARLFDEVQARTRELTETLAQQTATAEVLKVISRSVSDAAPVFETILESCERLFDPYGAAIYLVEGDRARGVARRGFEGWGDIGADVTPLAGSSTGKAIAERKPLHFPDLLDKEDLPERVKTLLHESGGMTLLYAPMISGERGVGSLVVTRRPKRPFSDAEIDFIQTFADQAVIAIENARLFAEVQARTREVEAALERQTATADILKVIASSPADAAPVFRAIALAANTAVRGWSTGVFRFVDGEAHLMAMTSTSPEGDAALRAAFPLPLADFPPFAYVRHGGVEEIPDTELSPDPRIREIARARGYRSMCFVPLANRGEVIGLLSVTRVAAAAFAPTDVAQMQAFADQAVIAIQNARLFEEVQARTRDVEHALERQTATSEILRVISQSPTDAKPVFDSIVLTAARLLHCDLAFVMLTDGKSWWAAAVASPEGPSQLMVVMAGKTRPVDPAANFPARAIVGKATLHLPDWSLIELPEHERQVHESYGINCSLYLPLLRDGECIGVITLTAKTANSFGASEIAMAESFRDQALIAMENARLFEVVQARTREVENALERQTATSEILRVIASAPGEADKALQFIAETCARLFSAPSVSIQLAEGGEFVREFRTGAIAQRVGMANPRSMIKVGGRNLPGTVVAQARQIHIPDLDNLDPSMADFPGLPHARAGGARTVCGTPLRQDDRAVGAMIVFRDVLQPFSADELAILQTFADQAVIAIENARLLNEVQARTRDLEESLAQQTATADVLKVISRSAFDLDAIFQTLVATAVDLCGASSGTLCVRDGEVFRYRGIAGPEASPALQQYLEAHPLAAPDRGTVAGRAILSRQTEEIVDVLAETDYAVPFSASGSSARSLLGVPLMGKTEVLGAIVVTRPEPGAFPPRHVEILRTFADQAVIAIENSRLFEQVQARTRELEQSLSDLRKAQDRLVQSEKLASLGQLTAGIAHEIKNPLNFVNNFATLSRELMEELRETLGKLPEDVKADADDLMGMIDSNLEKVASHGKRADSIVKNMLLHSREGSGERTAVNINAMVEEALNLGYHGARAEKPGFNVTLEKRFDPAAGQADIYLQEVTRVLLNLISNGFYASSQRKSSEGPEYEPTLTASTRDLGHSVEIRIRDNGTGIPDEVRAKMFDPFFTTKPAGEGTGLGLSLSHDIVVKQHGGTLDVETQPGAFTEFVLTLPREWVRA